MNECKACLLHSMCYLTHAPTSVACGEFVDRTKFVGVVRCKDCFFWDKRNKGIGDECVCGFHSDKVFYFYSKPNDFCSYGERKDGADNE